MCAAEASGEEQQHKGLRAEILGQTFWFQILALLVGWVSYLTSLSLSLRICKMGVVMVPASWGYQECMQSAGTWETLCKAVDGGYSYIQNEATKNSRQHWKV